MDQRIVWTEDAEDQLFDILEYWKKRNQSLSYPIKIKNEVDFKLQLILQNPEIGRVTELPGIRSLNVLTFFKIIYGMHDNQLVVLNIWDMRQDPIENPFL